MWHMYMASLTLKSQARSQVYNEQVSSFHEYTSNSADSHNMTTTAAAGLCIHLSPLRRWPRLGIVLRRCTQRNVVLIQVMRVHVSGLA